MIAQVPPDGRQMMQRRDAPGLQIALVTDARVEEQVRRMERAAAHDDFLARTQPLDPVLRLSLDADRALAVEQHAPHARERQHLQVAPPERRLEIRTRGRHAPAFPDRALSIAVAVRIGHVEIVDLLEPERRHARVERIAERVAARRKAHAHRSARRVVRRARVLGVVLGAQEVRQEIRVRPAGLPIAAQSSKSLAGPRKYAMPLIEPVPPITRPRGSGTRRPCRCGCGTVESPQPNFWLMIAQPTAAGIRMNGWRC